MTGKLSGNLLMALLSAAVVLIGGGVRYYVNVWKPKSPAAVPTAAVTAATPVKPGGVAALLKKADGTEALAASASEPAAAPAGYPAPEPAVAAVAPVAAPPVAEPAPLPAAVEPTGLHKLAEFSTGEKPDQLLAKRAERRFAKLREWSAKLTAKRATLKTALQIEAFNEEAQKYHAELNEARQEAAEAQRASAPRTLFAN